MAGRLPAVTGSVLHMSAIPSKAFESAVTVIPEPELRAFVLQWARGATSEFRDALVEHASRAVPDWEVPYSDPTLCSDARALVAMATRRDIEPHEMDSVLERAGRVLVAGQAVAAREAYDTVLRPLSQAEISLPGVDEFPDEVLSSCMYDVCARYLLATYESSPEDVRIDALVDALKVLDGLQHLECPIRMIESAATRPLDGFDVFVERWLARLRAGNVPGSGWAVRTMLDEAILRAEGIDGLQREARTIRTADAYRAWCHALRKAELWPQLLEAVEEAAGLVKCPDAVAAYHEEAIRLKASLGRVDGIRAHLEAAFASRPTLGRLSRLIDDEAPDGVQLRARARVLLERAGADSELEPILRVFAGDYQHAVQSLVAASAGRWRSDVLFASLIYVAGGKPPAGSARARLLQCIERVEPGLLEYETPDQRLPTTPIVALLDRCGDVGNVPGTVVLEALRATAWRRIDAVTSEKHRSQYAHGALLAACAAELQSALGDPSGASLWLAQVRQETRYLPRFQRELAALWPSLA